MIVQYPSEILRQASELIVEGEDVGAVLACMRESLDRTDGLGIAAVQVGFLKSIIIAKDIESNSKTIMLNPEIISNNEKQVISEEGCLSIGVGKPRCKIKRYETVSVRYQDLNFETHTQEYSGLMSIILQHEIDHCNGTLIIDHLSRLKKEMFVKKLSKL